LPTTEDLPVKGLACLSRRVRCIVANAKPAGIHEGVLYGASALSLDCRNWDTVLCQKLPQAVVFLSQAVTFPLRGLKLSLKFFAGHKRTVILPISELFCGRFSP